MSTDGTTEPAGNLPSPPLVIGVDKREKKSYRYTFECMRSVAVLPYEVHIMHLVTGDYTSLQPAPTSYEDQIVIERKSLADLYTTLGTHRDRFEHEWERMSVFGHAAVVIEATWDQIMQPNSYLRHESQLPPKSVFATLIAWSQRYGVHVHAVPGRDFAERMVFRMLERWQRDQIERSAA